MTHQAVTETPWTATDVTGTTITLSAPAQRIICMASPGIDMLLSLGMEPLAILKDGGAETAAHPRFFGDRVEQFPRIGGAFFTPNLDDVRALKPDLIIAWAGDQASVRESLPDIPIFYTYTVRVSDAIRDLQSLGILTEQTSEADAAIARFETRVKDVQAHIAKRIKTAVLLDGSDELELMTEQTLLGNVLSLISEYPFPLPEGGMHFGGCILCSFDDIVQHDPDVLFTITATWVERSTPLNERLANDPQWSELWAIKNHRMHEVPATWASTGGLQGVTVVLDEILPLIYPDMAV
ncbi:MAG: ABC transporter substrate-binding protein [Chloroflexota bacterium]